MDSKRFWTSETQMYYDRQLIVSANGCYLYDSAGNKYLDANSSTWNVFLGHGKMKFLNVFESKAENWIIYRIIFLS